MPQVVLDIRNEKKAGFFLDWLRQLDFIEIKQVLKGKDQEIEEREERRRLDDVILNAPVLSEEEIKNIERVGKEFRNWKIEQF